MARRSKTVKLLPADTSGSTRHGTSYLYVALGDPAELVYDAMKKLKDVEFDTMIGRGLSGALVVPLLARAMSKHFAIVRKDNDGSHSESRIEGRLGSKWLFVDDLICSGTTFKFTLDRVKEAKQMEFAGMYMYGSNENPEYRGSVFHSLDVCKSRYGAWLP